MRRFLPFVLFFVCLQAAHAQATPRIFSVSPGFAPAGNPQITIAVTGEHFHSNAVVEWNGAALSTSYVSGGQLTATVPVGDLDTAENAAITVSNPAAASSPAVTFAVFDAPPVYSWQPRVFTAGADAPIIVYGDNFLPGSEVLFDGCLASSTTFVSATQLTAVIPSSCITGSSDQHAITVSFGEAQALQLVPNVNTPSPIVATVSPSAVNFGNQTVGTTSAAAEIFHLSAGQANLQVYSIALSSTAAFSETNTCPISPSVLSPGDECFISVTFAPGAATSYTASLSVASNASNGTQAVSISGTGVAAGSPPPSSPAVQLSPSGLNFGSVPTGTTSSALTSTLTNTGTATLNISAIAVTGANASDFTLQGGSTCAVGTVAASASCTLVVKFGTTIAQNESASISVTDDASGSPQSVPMTARGFLPTSSSGGYYIDYASGSNSNDGRSEATAWKTHPYMSKAASCTGTGKAPGYTHRAGDQFVFKGGVTWPAACLPLTIAKSGTSGAVDYYGVDASWHAGGSWTRPVFDAAYATKNNMINASGKTYLTIDNLELEHQGITPTVSFSTASCGIYFANLAWGGWMAGTTVENVYIHDWAVTSNLNASPANNFDNVCVGGIMGAALVEGVETSDAGGYAYIGGVQTFNPFGGGVAGVGELKNSKIHDGWNGCTTSGSCHDSEFYNISGGAVENYTGVHSQVIEDNEPCPSTVGNNMPVYNNSIHDNVGVGVVLYVRYFNDVYSNVFWNNSQNEIQYCVPSSDSSSHVGHNLNNTYDQSGGNVPIQARTGAPTALGTLYVENNVGIASMAINISAATQHYSNNFSMSTGEASTYGFTSARKYFPSSSDPNVAAQGANLTSFCSGSLAALCSDAQGTPWYGGSAQPRPTGSTAWDLGLFQF